MFKTESLICRSVYETPELVCMDVRTKFDNVFIVSLSDFKPHFDENWINEITETSVIHLSHEDVKKEIVEGLLQYRNVRM